VSLSPPPRIRANVPGGTRGKGESLCGFDQTLRHGAQSSRPWIESWRFIGTRFRRLTRTLLGKEYSGTLPAMASVRITAKRQATLPAALCEELGVGPGDNLLAERRVIRGETVWVLRPRRPDWSWLGAARAYAAGKSHRWRDVRRSIAKGWAANARP
jgi:bifunctional DNA-binding transcriptional regulator/antitoxin component of YhaV-PrlF toxin-antitoxin module